VSPADSLWEASPTPMNHDMTSDRLPQTSYLHTLSTRHCCLYLAFLVALPGCNRSSIELAPVHGKVTIDSKPLFQGKVRFAPVAKGDNVNSGKSAWGNIQPDGTFRLTTNKNNDGAAIGEHWVTIMNSEEKLPKGVKEFSRLLIPKTATVAANTDNEINFAFSNSDVNKFSEDD
jgi:hypothetical protein